MPKPHASEARYSTISREAIDVYVSVLRESIDDLERICQAMDQSGITEMPIDGATKFSRGQQLVAAFVGNLEVAVSRARATSRRAAQRERVEGGA